jgi:hypothetical protein
MAAKQENLDERVDTPEFCGIIRLTQTQGDGMGNVIERYGKIMAIEGKPGVTAEGDYAMVTISGPGFNRPIQIFVGLNNPIIEQLHVGQLVDINIIPITKTTIYVDSEGTATVGKLPC